MVSSITGLSVNPLQKLNASNAFKNIDKVQNTSQIQDNTSNGLDINESGILENQNVQEIRNIAQINEGENLSDDDIKYGLTYGRSVIADYVI
ncbi:MAG: hypothetical protein MJ229_08325 [bacterium]|nr:hypothetical protein [bacterium]